MRKQKNYSDGICDGFEPLQSLDLNKVKDFDELAKAMSMTGFGGRRLGEAVDTLYEMVMDPDCFVVGTFSGAMTPAKMGLLICDMIDQGMINAMVSTGALMTHGMIEATGMTHFKYKEGQSTDAELYKKGYNRIYDVLELEKNLDDLDLMVYDMLDELDPKEVLSSRTLCQHLGKSISKKMGGRGILISAYKKGIPIYIPAFTDSELGLDFATTNRVRAREGKELFQYNPFIDLEHFADLMQEKKQAGIFTIGGGVPRNWAQQVGPYLDYLEKRLGDTGKAFRYKYGVRICPEPVHWGGLSGCTYSEGVSWGKFVPRKEGGKTTEVMADATIAWPIILKAVMQRIKKNRKNKKRK
ncbi:MAG: deoxyhypusine synthase family protein [Parcubacteria group bacterium]|jgi:deoxyhypusine synthase